MSEEILKKLFCMNKPLAVFWGRFIIGIVLAIYGFLIFFLNSIEDQWARISIALAFWSLGLMFIFDGRTILKEYFNPRMESIKSSATKEKKEINWNKIKINFLGVYLLLILITFVLIGIKFYFNQPENKLIFSLILIACSGGIGGTLYSIRGFYQSLGQGIFDIEKWMWWYIFRPIMSAVIGIFVYFLIVGGLLSIGNVSDVNYSKGLMFYSAIAFLAGFSFTQFANKLEELASTIFAKNKERKK